MTAYAALLLAAVVACAAAVLRVRAARRAALSLRARLELTSSGRAPSFPRANPAKS